MAKAPTALKRIFVGRPMSSGELEHTLLPKTLALPVFSSDPLSSVAYASQEILLVLGTVGTLALGRIVPISFAVASLLLVVVVSYRQTVRAYPNGGGAYIVAHENLGTYAGLFAASALLIDYVLTVSVSITAGTDAIVSAVQGLDAFRIEIAVGFIILVTLLNLRGARESGTLFAIPTYGFVLSIAILLATGAFKCIGGCPQAESAGLELEPLAALTPFLLLRAFSAGTTALTGVEAISNGVPAFRYPQSHNAASTLAIMGGISISMFLGISLLTRYTGVRFSEEFEDQRTVVAQIAHAVFEGGFMFYVVQIATAAILILAANTAYADFPRLSSILAQDRFMPRQFMNRGDRLVFSNGILILAVLASVLVIVFEADLNQLIQLYLVGVFVSFTLSQAGMVVHWRKTREPGWNRSAFINAIGATVTGVVLCVVVVTKFTGGAWIVVTAQPIIMFMMVAVNRHYEDVRRQLSDVKRRPKDLRPGNQHVVIYLHRFDASAVRAVGYVRSIATHDVSAATLDESIHGAWHDLAPDIPLNVLEGTRGLRASLKAHVRAKRKTTAPQDFVTVVIPELLEARNFFEILLRPRLHRLKASLLREVGVQVLDIPVSRDEVASRSPAGSRDEQVSLDLQNRTVVHAPARNYAVVLVAGVHNASLYAIEFAETLAPTDIEVVTFGLDPTGTENLGNKWIQAGIPFPLEIVGSPYRHIGSSLREYVRQFEPDGVDRVVTVVIPEFIVQHRRHQILHGQTATLVKRHLLFERGVVVASVPFHLGVKQTDPVRGVSSL